MFKARDSGLVSADDERSHLRTRQNGAVAEWLGLQPAFGLGLAMCFPGMDRETFESMSDCDAVIHCAAIVPPGWTTIVTVALAVFYSSLSCPTCS